MAGKRQERQKFTGNELALLILDRREDIIQDNLYQLQNALLRVASSRNFGPFGFDPTNNYSAYLQFKKSVDCDMVYPQILIGNGVTARNKTYLRGVKVTHVLNAAECAIRTGANYYQDDDIEYLGFKLQDLESSNISQYFEEAADFIDEAVNSKGLVYVHCYLGVSRSATLVIAYLMIKKNMLVDDALKFVKRWRYVRPNDGFLRQLVELDLQLRKKRDLQ